MQLDTPPPSPIVTSSQTSQPGVPGPVSLPPPGSSSPSVASGGGVTASSTISAPAGPASCGISGNIELNVSTRHGRARVAGLRELV